MRTARVVGGKKIVFVGINSASDMGNKHDI